MVRIFILTVSVYNFKVVVYIGRTVFIVIVDDDFPQPHRSTEIVIETPPGLHDHPHSTRSQNINFRHNVLGLMGYFMKLSSVAVGVISLSDGGGSHRLGIIDDAQK